MNPPQKKSGPLFVFIAGFLGIVFALGFVIQLVALPWDFHRNAFANLLLFGAASVATLKFARDNN